MKRDKVRERGRSSLGAQLTSLVTFGSRFDEFMIIQAVIAERVMIQALIGSSSLGEMSIISR
jgi:hypothetical protein